MAHLTEQDIAKQNEQIERMRQQLAQLNAEFDAQKKALGIATDEQVTVDPSEITPELEKAMQAVCDKAVQAGKSAAAEIKAETAPAVRPMGRRGALSI